MSPFEDRIRKDLLPFANPGTHLVSRPNGRWLDIEWRARSSTQQASFCLEDSGQTIALFLGIKMSYRSFLSAPQMSDMLGIAGMILQQHEDSIFIDTKGERASSTNTQQSAVELIHRSVLDARSESTTVVFVNADAGAGKTEVLRTLVRRQARAYEVGSTDFLYLYVNAQGRALARLEEALATEIQDLRASSLTYHVVPALARNKILVPLIDGFDELLGVMGYEDSFSSLRRFLNQLDGEGCIIASARSTYYQQEFLSRANRSAFGFRDITIAEVNILPWDNSQFSEYLTKAFDKASPIEIHFEDYRASMIAAFGDQNNALREKPFFVAAASSLILGGIQIEGKDFVEQLVDGFVERERLLKLLDRSGRPLITNSQIRMFLQAVSEEMWAAETRSLDQETIRTLAELAFDKSDDAALLVLQERSPTMAFFTVGSDRGGLEFEHELLFSYFLGAAIGDALQSASIYSVLVRAPLPDQSAAFAAITLRRRKTDLKTVLAECARIGSVGSIKPTQVKENAALIVLASMREEADIQGASFFEKLSFEGLEFAGANFSGLKLHAASFKEVEFKRCDFTGFEMHACQATNVRMLDSIVDPITTILDIEGMDYEHDIYGLRVRETGKVSHVFQRKNIEELLINCGFPHVTIDEHAVIRKDVYDLLERLLRKFERSNVFWPTDDHNKQIVTDASWEELKSILISNRIILAERNAAQQGQPREHFRKLYSSDEIIFGQFNSRSSPPEILKFWKALESKMPAL